MECLENRGSSSRTFIALLALWISTGILLTILMHGPFADLARAGYLSSLAWYLDLRIILSVVLVVFILCRSLLIALKAPTRRLIREISINLKRPKEGGLFRSIVRSLIDSANDLLLRHLAHFVNLLTGLVSVILCYLAATGREIGSTIRYQVINFPIIGIILRRLAVFVALLFMALLIPSLTDKTLNYIRGHSVFDHVFAPIADIVLSLTMISAVQLLKPVDTDQFIDGAGRAVFFILCVLFGAKTIAYGLSYYGPLGFLYARNIDALYLVLLVCIVVASFVGFRPSDDKSHNKSGGQNDSPGGVAG